MSNGSPFLQRADDRDPAVEVPELGAVGEPIAKPGCPTLVGEDDREVVTRHQSRQELAESSIVAADHKEVTRAGPPGDLADQRGCSHR